MQKVEYRRFKKSDLSLMLALTQETDYGNKPYEYWEWKYYNNPAAGHGIYVICDSEKNRIGGLLGGIPVKMQSRKREVLSGQTCDIIIHPDYRGGGSYFKLERLSTSETRKRGCSFAFGFSNENTYQLSIRFLGFKEVCPLFKLLKIINPVPFLEKRLKMKLPSKAIGQLPTYIKGLGSKYQQSRCIKDMPVGLSVVAIDKFDSRFDTLWNETSKSFDICVVRDSSYLNWRYVEKPENGYKIFALLDKEELIGYTVLGISNEDVTRGRILDIFAKPDKTEYISFLLLKAEEYFIKNKADIIICWMLDHSIFYNKFLDAGFKSKQTNHSLIVKPMKETDQEYLIKQTNWYITMGDSDFF